jgi:hypothetical protein
MNAIKSLLVAALAAAGLAATADAQANPAARSSGGGHWGGGHSGGGHSGGGHWGGGQSGGGHWGGARSDGGHWRGGGRWSGGGHWGGYRNNWYGPRVGLYIGAPILWSSWYWGYPYDYYYPRTVIYDRVIERYPATYPDGVMEPMEETTEVAPRSEGAPTQPPTYMNYCESAKAYYPKVTSCPDGWKFLPSR